MSEKKTYKSSKNQIKNDKCSIAKKCGGCQYLDKAYDEQLKIKQKNLIKLLGAYGKLEPIVGMEGNPCNYRNKVTATFHRKKNGQIIAGTYEEGTHNVLDVRECVIENKKASKIISDIKDLVKSFKITVHNEDTGYGLLKHVLIRVGENTGQIMVVLVTSNPVFPSKKNFAKALCSLNPDITTIVQNVNDKHTSMVLGTRNDVIYGKGFIEDILCGKRFRISPTSFYQVNPKQTEVLYNKAMEFAKLTGKERVVDAYCGTGTIGIVAAASAKEVIGVELNKDAVRDAITNAKMNAVKNISFYSNDAGKFLVNMASSGEKVDVVFMDPPRTGSTKEFIDSVITMAPDRVVYVSCGPDTLARDLKYFTRTGEYKVSRMVGVDLFPFTSHCESVCLLTKVNT